MRFLRATFFISYLLLAVFGLWSFFSKTAALSEAYSSPFKIRSIEVQVSGKHPALNIRESLDALQEALKQGSVFDIRNQLTLFQAQEDWVEAVKSYYSLDGSSLNIIITMTPIWGFLLHRKRLYALTEQGQMLKGNVLAYEAAKNTHHAYLDESVTQQKHVATERVPFLYQTIANILASKKLSVSQLWIHPKGHFSFFVSNGVRIDVHQGEISKLHHKLGYLLGYLDRKWTDVKAIKFISSKKAVVALRRKTL